MKRALVTGCSSGIGLAVTQALLADGWTVYGASRTRPAIHSDEFVWAATDLLSDPLSVYAWQHTLAGLPLDALVHCAGSQVPIGKVGDVHPGAWADCVTTNLVGVYRVLHATLPALKRSQDGRILLFSGGGAFGPRPNYSAYAASKAGIVALMESLAEELRGLSVTANCVAPGFVPTPIHRPTLAAGPDVVGVAEYDQIRRGLEHDDGSRTARAVACVLHLLSDDTRGLTGKTISAEHDPWPSIRGMMVKMLNQSSAGTRTRSMQWPHTDAAYASAAGGRA